MIKTLLQNHPDGKLSNDAMMLYGPFILVNEIIFDEVNVDIVRQCVIRTKGSYGPLGLGADFWCKFSFQVNSYVIPSLAMHQDDLCHAAELLARMLCSEELLEPKSIKELVVCQLIHLDKSPGVRPIAVGEVFPILI